MNSNFVTPKNSSKTKHEDNKALHLFKCNNCSAFISPKDKGKHLTDVCKHVNNDNEISELDLNCGFILNGVIHAIVVNTKIKDDEPSEISSNLKNSVVFINPLAMEHCKLKNGDWICVKKLAIDNSETSCFIAYANEHLKNPCSVSFKNSHHFNQFTWLKISKIKNLIPISSFSLKCENIISSVLYSDLASFLRTQIRGRCFSDGYNFTVTFDDELYKFIAIDIKDDKNDQLNDKLEKLSLASSDKFYLATTTTKFKLIGNFTENLIKLDDIGGYQDEINALMDLIQLPLNNPQKLKQINIMPPKGVLIFGPPGTGKTMTMKALINEFCCQINCIKVDSASLLCKSVADSEIKLKALFSKALDEAPSILFLDNIENICPNKRTMNDQEKRIISTLITLLDELPEDKLILVIAATNKPESVELSLRRPGRFEREIEFSIPLPRERFQILKKLFSKANYDISDERLMLLAENVHSFTGADLAYSCREASLIALKDKKEKITENQLKLAFKLVRPSAMKEIVLEVPKVYWTDIGGMEIVKKKLIQAVVWPLKNPEAFNRIGIKPPRGVLMYGPPGCCKTMIGRALATESGLNFIAIKGPELFNKWVGESERAVREVFRKAKQAAPSILFFDEIDALAGERGVGQSTVGDRVLAQMLTELDGIETLEGVIIVASTNRPDLIDKALLRPGRLDSIIYVPLPDLETRKEILRISFKKIALKLENDLEQTLTYIAEKTNGYSGAEITAVCQEAGLIALENDINCDGVKTEHFIKSLDIVKPRTSQEMINFYETYSSKKNEINIKIN